MRYLLILIALLAGTARALAGPDVVLLGEIHDNPAHHVVQAEEVAALRPAALVLEMLTPEQAAQVTAESLQDPAALEVALGWAQSGWLDFAHYLPILQAAAGVPVYGALVPRAAARAALTSGVAAVFDDPEGRFGLAEPLPGDEQAAREAAQQEAHCGALPPQMLPGMVAIQRLRDAVLAETALRALQETGGPVAVITGNGHARADQGAPVYLLRAAPDVLIRTLGQGEDGVPPVGRFDHLRDAPAPDRADPCAAFSGK